MPIIRPDRVADFEALCKITRVNNQEDRERLLELAREAEARKGSAVYVKRVVGAIEGDDITIGGGEDARSANDDLPQNDEPGRVAGPRGEYETISVTFRARPLCRLFSEGMTVYPYAATCGVEMAEYGKTLTDPLEQYWWDMIMQGAVMRARNAIVQDITRVAGYEPTSANPGSLDMWPINNQPALFSLIGDVKAMIGVTVAPSFLMIPLKSVSGIFFPGGDGAFTHNCCLCTREDCPGRRAPFDAALKAQLEGDRTPA